MEGVFLFVGLFVVVGLVFFWPFQHDFLSPVPHTVQGSSAVMTAWGLWCWRETRFMAAPQAGLMTGAHLHTGNHHGCRSTPTTSTMSWVSTTAAFGQNTATSTSATDPQAVAATISPQELVRPFLNQIQCVYLQLSTHKTVTTFLEDIKGTTRWLNTSNQAQIVLFRPNYSFYVNLMKALRFNSFTAALIFRVN